MKPSHPWLMAAAWYILCMIAPMDRGGLTQQQTKSLEQVWLHPLPSCESEIDCNIPRFAIAFLQSFHKRKYASDDFWAETAFIRILAALAPAMMHHCKGEMMCITGGPHDNPSVSDSRPAIIDVQIKAQRLLGSCSTSRAGAGASVGLAGAFIDGVIQVLGTNLTSPSLNTTERPETAATSILDMQIRWACRPVPNEESAGSTRVTSNTILSPSYSGTGMVEVFEGLLTEFNKDLTSLHDLQNLPLVP